MRLSPEWDQLPLERLKKKTREELLWPYILTLLQEEPAYAYELRKKVDERFGWEPPLTTAYTVLYRLERGDYIEGEWRKEGNRPKKYYKITNKGDKILEESKTYFQNLINSLFKQEEDS